MIGQRRAALRAALAGADLLSAMAAFILAATWRFGPQWQGLTGTALPPRPSATAPLVAAVVVFIFWSAGLYRLRSRWTFKAEVRDLARALLFALALTLAALYLFRLQEVSRLFIGMYFLIMGGTAMLSRAALRSLFRWNGRRGRGVRNVLIVGGGPSAELFSAKASGHAEMPIVLVGVVDDAPPNGNRPWLGTIGELPRILAEHLVDEVAICLPWQQWDTIDTVARHCEEQGKVVRIPVEMPSYAVARGRLEDIDGLPVLSLVTGPDRALALWGKRLMDVVGALTMLIITSPVWLVAIIAIAATDGVPVFFGQERGGIQGRPFRALKFRTMVRDAEARQAALMDVNERVGPAFKVTGDPRVTSVGRFLRRTSIDELPQLLNVLKGDMSLVGPRPQPMSEVEAYDLWHRRRLSVKPGLTGLWQVTARHDASFDRWVSLDLDYIDHWSLWQDAKLLVRTPAALVRSPGA